MRSGGPPLKPESPDPEVNTRRALARERGRVARLLARQLRAAKVSAGGVDRNKAWVDGVGPAPGELPPAWVPRPQRGPEDGARGPIADPANQGKDYRKELDHFLYPAMPAAFSPYEIKKWPVDKLRERYLHVLSATMGNHSIALFYCCWAQEQFEAAAESVKFRKAIERTRAQLADRATFLMHRGMGLIRAENSGPPNMQVSAALAKVVESLKAKDVEQESGGGFSLVVEGLDTKTPTPAAPDRKP